MKTYLITGEAGFIEINFILYLLNKYKDIKIININKIVYDNNLQNLIEKINSKNYSFIEADVCDEAEINKIFNDNDIDYVVNFSKEHNADKFTSKSDFIYANVLGTQNLLNASVNAWKKGRGFELGRKFLQVCTNTAYDFVGNTNYLQKTSLVCSSNSYLEIRNWIDCMVKAYHTHYNIPVNIIRSSCIYGPFQASEYLIPSIINNCISKKPIVVCGIDSNVRKWLYVGDYCRALDTVLKQGKIGEVYDIAGQSEESDIYVAKTIVNYINKSLDKTVTHNLINPINGKEEVCEGNDVDFTKIEKELGWKPIVSFEAGIQKTIKWYLNNKKWFNLVPSIDLSPQTIKKDKRVKNKKQSTKPVVIGGVGGSGTRIVAEIFKQMNYYIGNDLNGANDNLGFAILINRAKWFLENNKENKEELMKRFNIFERIMSGCFEPEHEEFMYITNVVTDFVFSRLSAGLWGITRVTNMLKSNKIDVSQYSGWGWKDPATYLFLEPIKEYFKSYKYIHVIRHGLDMAYSKNILHLTWFGKLFGVETPRDSSQLPKALLDFWIKANNEAINNAKQILGENFLLVNFDDLCLNPVKQVNRILEFLGTQNNRVDIDKLYKLPQKVQSMGRYKEHDLSIFSRNQIKEVRKLGFTV